MNVTLTTAAPEPDQPRRFGDRFRATRVLKPTPSGETLRGIDAADGREVVIRTVSNSDPGSAARHDQELTAPARLDGPSVVRPIGTGRQGGVLYWVLPHVPGLSLESHLLGRTGPLSVLDALTVGRGVLAALAEAHRHGLVHGDVRPSNVVVRLRAVAGGPIESATLTDFGVSNFRRVVGSPPESDLRAARYMSPEAAGLVPTTSTSARTCTPPARCCSSAWPAGPSARARRSAMSCASTSARWCPGCAASGGSSPAPSTRSSSGCS